LLAAVLFNLRCCFYHIREGCSPTIWERSDGELPGVQIADELFVPIARFFFLSRSRRGRIGKWRGYQSSFLAGYLGQAQGAAAQSQRLGLGFLEAKSESECQRRRRLDRPELWITGPIASFLLSPLAISHILAPPCWLAVSTCTPGGHRIPRRLLSRVM
jgi:hypothetical protein